MLLNNMFIDISNDLCPITFVKTKLALERLPDGECLTVKLKEGESLDNVTKSVHEMGYSEKDRTNIGSGIYAVTFFKPK